MEKAALAAKILVDCSHANSGKVHSCQPEVFENVLEQRLAGEHALRGMMIESHLCEGSQALGASMQYGVSVTDACLGWEDTEAMLRRTAMKLARSRKLMFKAS
ncbi:Phospho-2-dehydro-3-deoxyheptonate aldolase, Phe-sensitive [compost metagenome]